MKTLRFAEAATIIFLKRCKDLSEDDIAKLTKHLSKYAKAVLKEALNENT